MRAAACALALLLSACGGSSSAKAPQAPATGEPATGDGSAARAPASDAPPGAPLSDAECDQLADHLVDVSFADRRAKQGGAGGEPYTAEDAEAAKRELRQSLRPACPTVPRRDFTCALAAKSSAELGACQK